MHSFIHDDVTGGRRDRHCDYEYMRVRCAIKNVRNCQMAFPVPGLRWKACRSIPDRSYCSGEGVCPPNAPASVAEYSTLLDWTAEGPGFESWFGLLSRTYVIGLLSWSDIARYSLFLLKVPLHTYQSATYSTLSL